MNERFMIPYQQSLKVDIDWNEMTGIDLPSLQSIELGRYALYGNKSSSSSSLKMRSMDERIRNDGCRSSKSEVHYM